MFREKLEEFKASNDKKKKITQIISKKVNENTTSSNYLLDNYFDRIANAGSYAKQEIDKIIEEHGGWEKFQNAALEYKAPSYPENVIPLQKAEPSNKLQNDFKTSNPFHLYMPWNPGYCETQMFDLKKSLKANGTTHIPKLNKTKGKDPYSKKTLELLKKQIQSGVETRLYMTDFRSIHVWKISDIIWNESEVNSILNLDSTLDFYKGIYKSSVEEKHEESPFEFWMKVDDLFVLWVDHEQSMREFLDHLSTLSECDPSNPFYNPEKKITPYRSGRYPMPVATEKLTDTIFKATYYVDSTAKDDGKAAIPSRWLNTHRQVTKEYLLMQSYLEKHIYSDIWHLLGLATKHYLTEFEMLRLESSDYLSIRQRLQFSKQVFDCFLSAVLNTLHNVFGEEFATLMTNKEWESIEDKLKVRPGLQLLLPHIPIHTDEVADIGHYTRLNELISATSLLPQINPTDLCKIKVTNFIKKVTPLSDKILSSKLLELRETRNWFSHSYYEMLIGEDESVVSKNIDDIAKIIDFLSVPHSKNNIFYIVYSLIDPSFKKTVERDDMSIKEILARITHEVKLKKAK